MKHFYEEQDMLDFANYEINKLKGYHTLIIVSEEYGKTLWEQAMKLLHALKFTYKVTGEIIHDKAVYDPTFNAHIDMKEGTVVFNHIGTALAKGSFKAEPAEFKQFIANELTAEFTRGNLKHWLKYEKLIGNDPKF